MHIFLYMVCLFYCIFMIHLPETFMLFKIFTSIILSAEPDFRTGRLLVFLLCWVRFGILFLIKKDFRIPWNTILLLFINPFRIKEKVGRKNQVCLYVLHRKYFI